MLLVYIALFVVITILGTVLPVLVLSPKNGRVSFVPQLLVAIAGATLTVVGASSRNLLVSVFYPIGIVFITLLLLMMRRK